MVEVTAVDSRVWERRAALDKEVDELVSQAKTWGAGVTHKVTFTKAQPKIKSILNREMKPKKLKVRMVENDPKCWFVMIVKRTRPRKKARELVHA